MTERLNICVVEDDTLIIASLQMIFDGAQNLSFFTNIHDALKSPKLVSVDALLLDLCHPGDLEGQGTIRSIPEFRAKFPEAYICVQSGRDDLELMLAAIQNGADRYILKDSLAIEVPVMLERLQTLQQSKTEIETALVGQSSNIQRLRRDVLMLRSEGVDVLIEGETGTGKEVCARALHARDNFVAVNCSAIPPELFESEFFGNEKGAFSGAHQAKAGYFEAASAGTLFLDEVQSLSLPHQAKLLRALEERSFMRVGTQKLIPFKARVISAANENLREKIKQGTFREDLYFRLAPLRLELPPLRSRREDVPLLVAGFLKNYDTSKTKRFSPEAMTFLQESYEWPGNVRQLRSLVQALCVSSPIPIFDLNAVKSHLSLEENSWTASISTQVIDGFQLNWELGLDGNVNKLERYMILEASKKGGPQGAIEMLKISKSRFYEKLKLIKG